MNRRWWIALAMVVTLWGCQERFDPLGPRDLTESGRKAGGGGSDVRVTVLVSELAGVDSVTGTAINDDGEVVGFGLSSPPNLVGFHWYEGSVQPLGSVWLTDVASGGRISGHEYLETDRPAVWNRGAGGWTREFLPMDGDAAGYAEGMSDDGTHVAGFLSTGPVVWTYSAGWTVTRLHIGGGRAMDVNDAGLVVGAVGPNTGWEKDAVAWTSGGALSYLPPLTANQRSSFAKAVNNRGDIVGHVRGSDGKRKAVLWIRSGAGWASPVVVSGKGWDSSFAVDISDRGQVVLNRNTSPGGLEAYVWDPGTGRQISLPAQGKGFAWAINELNQVVGESGGAAVMWTLP